MVKRMSFAVAGVLGLAMLAGPSAAWSAAPERSREVIRLRVPVKMHSMLADKVRVRCWIRVTLDGQPLSAGNGTASDWFDMPGGELDRVIEMVMTPRDGFTFTDAKVYNCLMELPQYMLEPISQRAPISTNDAHIRSLAKPGEFFRKSISGRLVPRRWPSPPSGAHGDYGASDDLAGDPRERE